MVKKSRNNLRSQNIYYPPGKDEFEQPDKIVFDLYHFNSQNLKPNFPQKRSNQNNLKSVHLNTITLTISTVRGFEINAV